MLLEQRRRELAAGIPRRALGRDADIQVERPGRMDVGERGSAASSAMTASRRARNSATIAAIAASAGARSLNAASAACCDPAAAFDVVCDWKAVIAAASARGAIAHPIRHPVIAYALATPSTITSRSRFDARSSRLAAGAS